MTMTNKFFFFILKQTHTIGNKTTFRAIFNYFLTFAVGPVGVGLDPRPLQPVVAPLYPSCRPPGCKKCFCNDDIHFFCPLAECSCSCTPTVKQ